MKFGEYVHSLYVPTSLNLVKMKPLRGTALFILDAKLVFKLVDNFFGGDGRHAKIEGREFTPTELRVVRMVLELSLIHICSSLHEVELTLLLTIGLVVLVMGLFLRQLSATLIVATVLAVSLSASFAAMYVLGFTLNNLTLVALIIAVGFIVDDAIVVVENIHRHLEAGASKVEAALKGAAEIGFTVISISFSPVSYTHLATRGLLGEQRAKFLHHLVHRLHHAAQLRRARQPGQAEEFPPADGMGLAHHLVERAQ